MNAVRYAPPALDDAHSPHQTYSTTELTNNQSETTFNRYEKYLSGTEWPPGLSKPEYSVAASDPKPEQLESIEELSAAPPQVPEPFPGLVDYAAANDAIDNNNTFAEIRRLSELKAQGWNNPGRLLGRNYACRGSATLVVAQTGIGKSTFTMQLAIYCSAGQPFFGIEPNGKLKTMIVQAENDEEDTAQMRDGIINTLRRENQLSDVQCEEALNNIYIIRDVFNVRDNLGKAMDHYIEIVKPDLVILDPVFAYLGGDANSNKDVSYFLREVLDPLLLRHNVGLILVHHSNKPPTGVNKSSWQGLDFAYLGSGSSEFANWPRSSLAIRAIGSKNVFELVASKKSQCLGWLGADGKPTNKKYIKHATHGICWLEANDEDLEVVRKDIAGLEDCYPAAVGLTMSQVWKICDLKKAVQDNHGITNHKWTALIRLLKQHHLIGTRTYYNGKVPVYLIGPKHDVAEYNVDTLT